MIFGTSSQDWQVSTEGTYGEFHTPAGPVSYLMTKAKLGGDTSKESTLTLHLAPVREVMNLDDMDFNQLLQRDLDDYRVATELVDYLLNPKFDGPAFYTPVLAAVLPFDGSNPVDSYPPLNDKEIFEDADKVKWQQSQYGDAFRVLKLYDEKHSTLHKIKLGRLEFNPHRIKLAVIDGQHRVMALLAIRRTVDQNWETTKGNPYRFFYEKRIKELLRNNKLNLTAIEFPVCICWFPENNPELTSWPNPHKSARKLFVDVNKNAKTPSKSRLILLSDTELVPIFVRSVLNRLRQPDAPFPLHAIEYDYPHDQGEGAPARPTAIASVMMLNSAVEWALLGPNKYIKDVSKGISGRSSKEDKDFRLRSELELKEWLTSDIEDEGMSGSINFERNHLGNDRFPRSKIQELTEHFINCWGNAILEILSTFIPFKNHIEALKTIEDKWTAALAHGELAKDAMFKGLGIYWTLKSDYEQSLENSRSENEIFKELTETGKAWRIIEEKEKEFSKIRAKLLFDRKRDIDEDHLKISEHIYTTIRTQAFLSGSVLILASLKYHLGYDANMFNERVNAWINSWNTWLTQSSKRIQIFDRTGGDRTEGDRIRGNNYSFLNFTRLEPSCSIYFRYLMLEIMASIDKNYFPENEVIIINDLLRESRRLYLAVLEKNQIKFLKRTEPNLPTKERQKKAKQNSEEILRNFCKTWFNITKSEFDDWLLQVNSTIPQLIFSEEEEDNLGNEEVETIDDEDAL